MNRVLTVPVTAVLLLLFIPGGAACSCVAPGSPNESLRQADAVFAGTVDRVVTEDRTVRAAFNVSRIWKGPTYNRLVVSTADNTAACGYPFTAGDRYIVYAQGTHDDLTVSLCSRTARYADATDDIAALGAGDAPTQEGVNAPVTRGHPWQAVAALIGIGVLVGAAVVYRKKR